MKATFYSYGMICSCTALLLTYTNQCVILLKLCFLIPSKQVLPLTAPAAAGDRQIFAFQGQMDIFLWKNYGIPLKVSCAHASWQIA